MSIDLGKRAGEAADDSIRKGGLLLWSAVLVGIGAWTVHLVGMTALVQYICNRDAYLWVLHLLTAVTLAATLAGMAFCWRMVHRSDDSDDSGSVSGRIRFLGLFGLLTGAINAALILLEGSYVLFISPCA